MSRKLRQDDVPEVRIESITLDDGRKAERHVTVDDNGNEVVEIFAEEKRPLKLEKRILREHKQVVAKETHQVVKDGEIVLEEVHSTQPEVPLQLRARLGVADHAKIVDGDYVRKEEINKLIADGVVAGVGALMEQMQPVVEATKAPVRPEPVFKAQEVVEKNVEEKKKSDTLINAVMVVLIVVQVAVFGYFFLT